MCGKQFYLHCFVMLASLLSVDNADANFVQIEKKNQKKLLIVYNTNEVYMWNGFCISGITFQRMWEWLLPLECGPGSKKKKTCNPQMIPFIYNTKTYCLVLLRTLLLSEDVRDSLPNIWSVL